MKVNKLIVSGQQVTTAPVVPADGDLQLEESYEIGSVTRGILERHTIALKKDQLAAFEFEDGTFWFSSDETITDIFPEAAAIQNRSAEGGFEIPFALQNEDETRGIISQASLKLLHIFSRKSIKKGVKELAEELEQKQLDNKPGLFRLDSSFGLAKDVPAATEKPFLLFLHGTASSTSGSFGELLHTELWKYIQQTYAGNVLAFQHETLTKSPLRNVLELVMQMPQKAEVHIISHSRGGLVGDVLSRFCTDNENDTGFSEQDISYFQKEGRDADIADITAIRNEIKSKSIRVTKFIRVACPASGTTLASGRFSNLFNIIFNAAGIATGTIGNPAFQAFKNLIAGVIDCKDDVSVLPGLEAMNPESPFIKVLNYPMPSAAIDHPLVVLSGNSSISLSLKALAVIASKLFFTAKNDLVVNTESMYNGTKRLRLVQYFFDEGAEVDHFHYFKNPKTNNAIILALQATGDNLIPGFARLQQGAASYTERNALLKLEGGQVFRNTVTGKRPIAVLLPGIMGSNLSKEGKLIWINYFRFLAGELTGLRFGEKDIEAPSLIKSSYKKLADYLGESYDVVTFPFDWRMQLNDCARNLNEKLIELMRYGQPIKLIGHSMGGVLVRDFIINHNDTWQKLNKTTGFRLLFLGSPLGGSFRIPYVLFGKDVIIDKISKIDIFHTKKELLEVFSNLPGLLSLLPLTEDAANDFARQDTWKKMRTASGDPEWPIPDQKVLNEFKAYRDNINLHAKNIDYSNAVYIAGRDKATPSGYEIDSNNALVFLSTAAGDQSVTWDSGIPKKMSDANTVYYAEVSHGALANDPALFKGISEILNTGATALLRKSRPSLRSAELSFRSPEIHDFDLSPEGIENSILGLGVAQQQETGEMPIRVSISNGDLKFSSFPILAGHFINDGILYSERAIDYNLKGALTERYQLGLYPGEIGTNEVVVTSQKDFNGAIIVGLGEPGALTAFQLSLSVEQGVSKYLLQLNSKEIPNNKLNNSRQTGISSLAIACGYGGLTVENSIRAIITGVQNANNKIRQTLKDGAKSITFIEFVEQFQDRALSSFYALNAIEKDEDQTLNIIFDKKKIKTLLGARIRLPIENNDEWWTRIHVKLKEYSLKEGIVPGLQFNISTGGAREEQRDLFTSREIIQELINDLSGNNRWTPQLAKTIFELLVPNDFKDQLKKQANISWIVDKDTASYPWELLQDSTNNAKPLCVNAGMVRQLATQDYRLKINTVSGNTALVIADPDLKGFINQLPGALAEGNLVEGVLKDNQYETTKVLRGTASEIIQALFSQDYKIIHLAGHGMFREGSDKESGMVIGNNVFLSTREISQMSTVPELVFVNCCHLGRTEGEAEALYRNRFRMAANIGTQLIENGVKVVIAAGWAVDDAAAQEFTEIFYRAMFNGYPFGEAVQQARKVIYGKYKHTNTWGAYQCYGDQFYTLTKGQYKPKAKAYVISQEAEVELTNLLNKLEIPGYTTEGLFAELQTISDAVDATHLRNGRITELEALICSGLYKYELAIRKYESLLQMEHASFSFSAMEQYSNIRAKYYVNEFRKTGKHQKELLAGMDKVIEDLGVLTGYSPTAERLKMTGSAYKRKAMLSNTRAQKIKAYKEAAYHYYLANLKKQDIYALINWLSLEQILILSGERKWGEKIAEHDRPAYILPSLKDAVHQLQDVFKLLASSSENELTYWDLASAGNIKVSLFLLDQKSGNDHAVTYEEVLETYEEIWDKAGSKGKKLAEVEHWEFLIDALNLPESKKAMAILAGISALKATMIGRI
jgi:CHAT domain-containing protein